MKIKDKSDFLARCRTTIWDIEKDMKPEKEIGVFTGERADVYDISFENKNGNVYYDSDEGVWRLLHDGPESVQLCIDDDHEISINEYHGIYSTCFYIDAPLELSESFELFRRGNENKLSSDGEYIVKLNKVFESFFVTIPTEEGIKLLPYNKQTLSRLPQEIQDMLVSWINRPNAHKTMHWEDYLKEDNKYQFINNLTEYCDRDLLNGRTFLSEKALKDSRDFTKYPRVVVRVSNKFSIMYIRDLLRYSIEGREILRNIDSVRRPEKILTDISISLPSSKVTQIRNSIALRSQRLHYKRTVSYLMEQVIDPFHDLISRYKKRREVLEFIYSDFLYDLDEIVYPLPAHLELPYILFKKADSQNKADATKHLLTLLIKIPLYLILEELNSEHPEFSAKYNDILYGKKPVMGGERAKSRFTDGEYNAILRHLVEGIKNNDQISINVYHDLVISMGRGFFELLTKTVEARNNYHHSRMNAHDFIEECSKLFPELIDTLRKGLRNTKILQVKMTNYYYDKKHIEVVAYNLAGPDRIYETVEINTTEDFYKFPKDKLVAYNASKNKAVILDKYFESEEVSVSTINLKILDQVLPPDQPKFESI